MEVKSFKILLDTNVIINLLQELENKEVSFYKDFMFLVRNNVFIICYTSFNLIEIAQANRIEAVFGAYSIFNKFENLHFLNPETSKIEKSFADEFLQRAIYKLFEYGNDCSLKQLEALMSDSDESKKVFAKYFSQKNNDFNILDEKIKSGLFANFQKSIGIHKGEYNFLSLQEAEENCREKYINYYDKIKLLPEASELPKDIFSKEFYENTFQGTSEYFSFELYKLSMLEWFGYKQKKISKIGSLNSLVDNYFLCSSHLFDFIITNDIELKSKICNLQLTCSVLSFQELKDLVFNLMSKLNEIRESKSRKF